MKKPCDKQKRLQTNDKHLVKAQINIVTSGETDSAQELAESLCLNVRFPSKFLNG